VRQMQNLSRALILRAVFFGNFVPVVQEFRRLPTGLGQVGGEGLARACRLASVCVDTLKALLPPHCELPKGRSYNRRLKTLRGVNHVHSDTL
jgi:hypothetical protein